MSKKVPSQGKPDRTPSSTGSTRPAATPARGGESTHTVAAPASSASRPDAMEPPTLTQEQIAVRAYQIWLDRGRPDGTDREDWYEAERQLTNELSTPQKDALPLQPAR